MFITAAAPPKRAANPMAPVSIGRAAAPELELAALERALEAAAVLMEDVGVGTPDVYGSLLALVALGKASAVVAVLTAAVAFIGFRTRSMT